MNNLGVRLWAGDRRKNCQQGSQTQHSPEGCSQEGRSRHQPRRVAQVALPFLLAGFSLVSLPVRPVEAARYYNPQPYRSSQRDYDSCAAGLLSTGLSPEDAAAACGGALYPASLSTCVTRIDSETEIQAADALSGCRRVRRPEELASCVVGITGISTTGTEPLDVLTYCRRSLLPLRFSNCVVGIAGQVTAYTTTEMMNNCIAATNRPRQVLPNFIPQGQEVPLQPLPNTETSEPSVSTPRPIAPTTPAPSTPRSVPALW
jgi:hypothetical protein